MCGGEASISIVDLAGRTEVRTLPLDSTCSAVDTCDDGSLLVASRDSGFVRRFVLDGEGGLLDTRERLWSGGAGRASGPSNVICGRGSSSGLVVRGDALEAYWDAVSYDVIRGELRNLAPRNGAIDLGPVVSSESSSRHTTAGFEDAHDPPAGQAWFYLVAYSDGERSSAYGTASAVLPQEPGPGRCRP